MSRKFGLIGYPLTHSFSKGYFTEKFKNEGITDAIYETFPLQNIEDFVELYVREKDLIGLNVTIPYKEKIIPFLDALSDEAQQIGAVNTIKFKDGKKIGYNSDVVGFENSLLPHLKSYHQKALILGTGGAAKAVAYVLDKLGIPFISVSRIQSEKTISYENITPAILQSHLIVINTTPLGMSPKLETFPNLPYDQLTEKHLLYDLVYNPEKTIFLEKGEEKGATIVNGLAMLHGQAERSWAIWGEGII